VASDVGVTVAPAMLFDNLKEVADEGFGSALWDAD
jgi:hypothetical protein